MDRLDLIEKAIKESSLASSVYVGCDSKRKGDTLVYVSTVVIHYDSNKGGAVFTHKETDKYHNIYTKLQGEIYRVAALANEIMPFLEGRKFEIHVDINPKENTGSNIAYKEAKGAILGITGIEPVFKPDAWAASSVADKRVNKITFSMHRGARKRSRKT